MIYVVIILLIIIAICFVISSVCERILCTPEKLTKDHEFEYILEHYGYDLKKVCESVTMEDFSVEVPNGYKLKGSVIPADTNAPHGAVIMVHGRTANRYTMLAHGEIWHRLGFNVIVFDQRAHGESGGVGCTMGYLESQDLIYLADEMRKRFPEITVWGLGGESMGSATLMMAAEKLPWLSFVYEDGGYATLRDEVAPSLYYKAKIPSFPFAPLTIFFFNLRHDFSMDDVRPVDSVRKISVPMLFVHGGDDRFVPPSNVYRLYNAKEGPKEIKVFEGSPHVKAAFLRHEEYYEMLKDFCIKYRFLKEED